MPAGDLPDDVTSWGTIRELSDATDEAAWQAAWSHLLERYRPVLISYARGLLFRMGGSALAQNDAEEVVDDFLAACLEKDWLARADPEMGRFRVFIRVLLARYARDWMQKRGAQRRMPKSGQPVSLDPVAEVVGAAPDGGAGEFMDREWAVCMARGAIERVRLRSKRNAIVLEKLLAEGEVDRDLLAVELGKEPKQVALIIYQARRMMAEELWAELKETVSDAGQLAEERGALRPFLESYLDPAMAQSFFGTAVNELSQVLPQPGETPPDSSD